MVSWVCLEMAYLMVISLPNEITMIGVPPILAQTSDIHNWHGGIIKKDAYTHMYIYIPIQICIQYYTSYRRIMFFFSWGYPPSNKNIDSWIWGLENYVFFNLGMVTDMHKVKTAWLFCVMVNKQLRSFSYTPKFYTTTLWYVYVWGKLAINI